MFESHCCVENSCESFHTKKERVWLLCSRDSLFPVPDTSTSHSMIQTAPLPLEQQTTARIGSFRVNAVVIAIDIFKNFVVAVAVAVVVVVVVVIAIFTMVTEPIDTDRTLVVSTENHGTTRSKKDKTDHQNTHRRDSPKSTNNDTNNKSKKPAAEVLAIRRQLQQCCKFNDIHKAMEVYFVAKADNTLMEAQTYYNLLNLCDGLGNRVVHVGTPKPGKTILEASDHTESHHNDTSYPKDHNVVTVVNDETRQQYALTIQSDMEQKNISLNETAYTALIRILSKAGKLNDANQLLTQAEQTQQCKARLRLYSSLFTAYCDAGDLKESILLWNRIQKHDLALTEKEYAAIMACATLHHDALVFYRALTDLAEGVLVPSKDTVAIITKWFQQYPNTECSISVLDDVPLFSSDTPTMELISKKNSWTLDTSCTIHHGVLQTGCLTKHVLQPVPLSEVAWKDMMVANEAIVLDGTLDNHTSTYQGGGKGRKRPRDSDRGIRQWKTFQTFLVTAVTSKSKELHIVLDGANIGYYKQNFEHAPKHVDYQQIDWAVQHFQRLEKTVLLVMHERHFSRKLMPVWAQPIVNKWINAGILFQAPAGMNDDWFWLHAALWGGRSTQVVTNDEMRDHHFQMLSPRSFLRWKERQQIHFSFGVWNGERRPLLLEYPAKYSRRIQRVADGLVVPLSKRGDQNRFMDGTHVANDDEPAEETYLCIRPSRLTMDKDNMP